MSKLLEIPRFLPNKGINLNKPEEFLKANFSVDGSQNMEFYNELLQSRLGMAKFDATVLSGPITLIDQFWLNNASWYLMICTTKDIYQYNASTGATVTAVFDILTPIYQTGTIKINTGAGSAVYDKVIGNDTACAWNTNLAAGDYIKVGTGSPTTLDTWYEIKSVDDANNLTLKTGASAYAAGTGYTARQIFQGTATDFWQATTFDDDTLGKQWIATNGVDTPIRWPTVAETYSGQVIAMSHLPTNFTAAKYLNVYKNRLFFWWCVVDGANLPMSGYWSGVADCDTTAWDNLDFMDLIEDNYWITGVTNFGDYQIVFRERDAQIIRYVGGDYVFLPEKSSTCGGVWAPNSIIETASNIYYYGPDNKFHIWNMLREDDLFGDELLPFMKNLDPNTEQYIYGWELESKNQIRWMIPYGDIDYHNYMFVYDYSQNVPNLWPIAKAESLWSMGEYLNVQDLFLDDLVWGEYYLDETEGFWDDRLFLSGAPVLIYGGYDGYLRQADLGTDDDGEAYTRRARFIRDNFGHPNLTKRLYKQEFWLESQVAGDITVSLKKDDSNSFDTSTKTISLVNANRDIIKSEVRWDREAQNFQTQIEATVHFALLGYLNKVFLKRKTF
jgi:hypothetical protein